MKALVTGATGFIGSHVAEQLVLRGHEVKVLTRTGGNRSNIAHLNVQVVEGDLRDADSLAQAAADCEAVFHVAADYRLWSRRPQELYDVNVEGTRRLLEACKTAKVRRLVYTSSVGTLGNSGDGTPGNETTPVTEGEMIGHYKRSKFQAEKLAKAEADAGNLDVVIVSPSTPVGERDIKPTPTGKIIVDFLNGKLPAFLDTGLNLVDVRDVAIGHCLAYELGINGERYILGNQNMSLQQILVTLGRLTGRRAPKVQIPYPVAWVAGLVDTFVEGTLLGRNPNVPIEGVRMARKKMFFTSDKAVRELGLPQTPVEDALRRAIDWFMSNGYVVKA